jgi:hypothetical protein
MFIAAIMVLLSILAHIRCDLPSNDHSSATPNQLS